MSIFQMRNNEPCITPEGVFIPEFKAIWNRDADENKTTAQKELAYVFHMADPKSAYAGLLDREVGVRADYLDKKPDKLLVEAIEKYKQLKETPTIRALISCQNLLEKMTKFFDTVNLKEFTTDPKTGKKTFTHDIGKITAALQKYEGVVSTIRKLKEEVEKELKEDTTKKRGNVATSILDDE